MKTINACALFLLTCAIFLGIDQTVQAAEENASPIEKTLSILGAGQSGENWSIVVGAKAWRNEWDLPLEFRADDKTFILEFESDPEITYIPMLLARYGKIFMGGSYIFETDYNFPEQQYHMLWIDANDELQGNTRQLKVSGSRKEWDFNVGYFITPKLAVSLGYKELKREISLLNSWVYDQTYYQKSFYPLSAHAPIVGIAGAAPIADRLNLYGNLAYGWLTGSAYYKFVSNGEVEHNNFNLDGNYTFVEVGLNYILPLKLKIASALSIHTGYRFQRLDMNFDDKDWGHSGDQHDATAGFVLGINAAL